MFRKLAVAFAAVAVAVPAFGIQRAFVGSTGNDANPCTLAQPCRGFAAAAAAVDPGGEIIVLDSAGYGTVTLTKSVSIRAPSGVYAGISAIGPDAKGIVVDGTDLVVSLSSLIINGINQGGSDQGMGILFVGTGGALHVEHCEVSGMTGAGVEIRAGNAFVSVTDTVLRDNIRGLETSVGGDGTRVVADRVRIERSALLGVLVGSATDLILRDSIITDGGGIGLEFYLSGPGKKARLEITGSSITRNAQSGVNIYASGDANTAAEGSISRSLIADNAGYGVLATMDASYEPQMRVTLDSNVIRGNSASGVGVIIGQPVPSGYVLGTHNTIVGNGQHGIAAGFGFVSRGDNTIYGNGAQQVAGTITTIGGI